jgi:hypothetical protein
VNRTGELWVVEVDGYDSVAGTVTTYRWGSAAFQTEPTDTLANTNIEPRLTAAPVIEYTRGSDGFVTGSGEVIIDNRDRALDSLYVIAFAGRSARILWAADIAGVTAAGAPPAVYTQLRKFPNCAFTLQDPEFNEADGTIRFAIGTNNHLFDVPLQPAAAYTGAGGVNGDANVAGKLPPFLMGAVAQVAPVLIDATLLLYQLAGPIRLNIHMGFFGGVSQGQTTGVNVYDSGLLLTAGADYVSVADLIANAPVAGQVRVLKYEQSTGTGTGVYFRLGSRAAGQVTADAVLDYYGTAITYETALASLATTATGTYQVVASTGLTAALTAPAATTQQRCGAYYGDPSTVTVRQVMQTLLAEFDGWMFPLYDTGNVQSGPTGGSPTLAVAFFRDPTTGADLSAAAQNIDSDPPSNSLAVPTFSPAISGSSIISMERLSDPSVPTTPFARGIANYNPYFTTQTSGLAGALTAAQVARYGRTYDTAQTVRDATVLATYPLAPDKTYSTSLSDAGAVSNFLANIYGAVKVRRDLFQVVARIGASNEAWDHSVLRWWRRAVGAVVTITGYNRFGCTVSRKFISLGIKLDARTITLTLWG